MTQSKEKTSRLKKSLTALFLLLASAGLQSACQPMTQEEAELPWSQPAAWEYQQPGMPTQVGD
jgi:hypothetical protein